jgi:hypothetical protein
MACAIDNFAKLSSILGFAKATTEKKASAISKN